MLVMVAVLTHSTPMGSAEVVDGGRSLVMFAGLTRSTPMGSADIYTHRSCRETGEACNLAETMPFLYEL